MNNHLMNFNPHSRELNCDKCNSINTKGVNYPSNIKLPDSEPSGKKSVVYVCLDCKNEFTKGKIFRQMELIYD